MRNEVNTIKFDIIDFLWSIKRFYDTQKESLDKYSILRVRIDPNLPSVVEYNQGHLWSIHTEFIQEILPYLTEGASTFLNVECANTHEPKLICMYEYVFMLQDKMEATVIDQIKQKFVTKKVNIEFSYNAFVCKTVARMSIEKEIDTQYNSKIESEENQLLIVSGLKILVVDDMLTNLMIMAKYLKQWGAVVETASSGKEALQKAEEHIINVVLLDLQMPEMDGYTVARLLRQKPMYKKIPIIAVSAEKNDKVVQESMLAGINGVLLKPINAQELYAELGRCYVEEENEKNEAQLQEQEDWEGIDFSFIEQASGGDVEFEKQIIRISKEEISNFSIKILSNFKENKPIDIANAIHKLKPCIQSFRFEKLDVLLNTLKEQANAQQSTSEIEQSLQEELTKAIRKLDAKYSLLISRSY